MNPEHNIVAKSSNKRLKVSGRMPSRQWTTDASFSEQNEEFLDEVELAKARATSSPMVMASASNAFLLRPVSRNSNRTPVEEANVDVKSPAAKAAIAAAVAAAKVPKDGISVNSIGNRPLKPTLMYLYLVTHHLL